MSGFTFHSSDIHGQTLKVARQQMLVEGDNSTSYDYFSICHELQLKFSWTKTKSVVQWLASLVKLRGGGQIQDGIMPP